MKTAVEWLQIVLIPIPYDEEDLEHNRKCWEQAKEMEEEHISKAYFEGWSCPHGEGFPETGEQYYNETFKK